MKISLLALVVGAVGAVLARLRRPVETPSLPDERAEELRRKLAEARAAAADQDDFEAAGMGAETIVEESPRAEPAEPAEPEPAPPAAEEKPESASPPAAPEPPPKDEFEAMRRRIHKEGKAAAEEMRHSADPPDKP
jgi:hypothetical protein